MNARGAKRSPGARQRRTSADTAAVFRAAFAARTERDVHPLLRPRPMTAEQVADLVERTRAAERDARGRGPRSRVTGIKHDRRRLRTRCAARYKMLERCSTREAARVFGVTESSVHRAWLRIREVTP